MSLLHILADGELMPGSDNKLIWLLWLCAVVLRNTGRRLSPVCFQSLMGMV